MNMKVKAKSVRILGNDGTPRCRIPAAGARSSPRTRQAVSSTLELGYQPLSSPSWAPGRYERPALWPHASRAGKGVGLCRHSLRA